MHSDLTMTQSILGGNMKYSLEMTQEQATLIQKALDLYCRILLGQFDEVGHMIADYDIKLSDDIKPFTLFDDRLQAPLNMISRVCGFSGTNHSFSINSDQVHDDARAAFDIVQVIRHKAWQERNKDNPNPSFMTVDSDTPRKYSSKHELPIIKEIE